MWIDIYKWLNEREYLHKTSMLYGISFCVETLIVYICDGCFTTFPVYLAVLLKNGNTYSVDRRHAF